MSMTPPFQALPSRRPAASSPTPYGTPEEPPPLKVARLLSRIDFTPRPGCWIWTGGLNGGRPAICHWGKVRFLYRVFFELLHGALPEGVYLSRCCRNARCVNPAHYAPIRSGDGTPLPPPPAISPEEFVARFREKPTCPLRPEPVQNEQSCLCLVSRGTIEHQGGNR